MDWLFAPAFTFAGAPTTWIEIVAVALSIAMVFCNIREIHWGWPLAAAASLLYFALFWRSKLYGDASLQVFFAVLAVWGWWQWLRGTADDGGALRVQRLRPRGIAATVAASAALWGATGWFLKHYTDTDVPWWDGFPTGLSLVAQVLLARKFIENWPMWALIDVVGMGLFAYKGLWLTAGLYGLFVVLCVLGWRQWRRQL